ncbi:hypothetical protein [Moorena sp. SIO3A2]|uniref:hypothetical protein n=1 Tax=Moorena sp. SIO3A2 TaxID=2607841 RepID=UPI0013B6E8A4|nr:hypothetical protein [Moorena sp. SIO3A2]NER90330.1 hypothetical protein [Moorena sp. SIO3A2]
MFNLFGRKNTDESSETYITRGSNGRVNRTYVTKPSDAKKIKRDGMISRGESNRHVKKFQEEHRKNTTTRFSDKRNYSISVRGISKRVEASPSRIDRIADQFERDNPGRGPVKVIDCGKA